MIRAILAYALCFIATVVGGDVFADDTACVYIDRSGLEKEVHGLSSVPYDLRRGAKCGINTKSDYLANPEEISLKGNVREQQISSPLGRITGATLTRTSIAASLTEAEGSSTSFNAARKASMSLHLPSFPRRIAPSSRSSQASFRTSASECTSLAAIVGSILIYLTKLSRQAAAP